MRLFKRKNTETTHVTPTSDNIIFFDTEFTDLNAQTGELISIGMIKMNGEELYLELAYDGEPHPWVVKNVLPHLRGGAVSKEVAQQQIRDFIGEYDEEEEKPYLMAYVNQFDAIFWYQLFGDPKNHPAFWIPLDFASILFAYGYPANAMGKRWFLDEIGVDETQFDRHNALDDARMLSTVYRALTMSH